MGIGAFLPLIVALNQQYSYSYNKHKNNDDNDDYSTTSYSRRNITPRNSNEYFVNDGCCHVNYYNEYCNISNIDEKLSYICNPYGVHKR